MAAPKQPSRRTKADAVYEALQSAIMSGTLEAGEHLRQEDVAAQWGVSQTPVREAFRRLESEGLVEHAANRGVVVRGIPWVPPAAPLDVLARRWQDLVADPESIPGSDFP
jgi:DNA-binding GntR family transcriptional regulator